MLKVVGHPDLGYVLDCRKEGSHDAEHVGPQSKLVRGHRGKDAANDNDDEPVEESERCNQQGSLPSGGIISFVKVLAVGIVGGVVSEEDEEQDEAVSHRISVLAQMVTGCPETYIKVKHIHCTPSCAMPRRPATQCNVSSSLQQATSCRDWGRSRMFAKADVADVVPSRMKKGEMPSEVPRWMIRACCGR